MRLLRQHYVRHKWGVNLLYLDSRIHHKNVLNSSTGILSSLPFRFSLQTAKNYACVTHARMMYQCGSTGAVQPVNESYVLSATKLPLVVSEHMVVQVTPVSLLLKKVSNISMSGYK